MDDYQTFKTSFLKKILIFGLIGIILVILELISFFFGKKLMNVQLINRLAPIPSVSPTSTQTLTIDETKNWKTYSDTENGFSFKYPDNFLKYRDPTIGFFVATSSPQGGNGPKFLQTKDLWLEVEILKNDSLKSTDEYLNVQEQKKFSTKMQQIPIIIDGVKGILIDYNTPVSAGKVIQYTKAAIILKSGKIFIVSLSSWSYDLLKTNKVLFNHILLTFKFVDL